MACNRNTPFNKSDSIKVYVVSGKGEVTTVDVKTKLSVDRIKFLALTNFIGDQIDAFQTVDNYKIVSIYQKRVLSSETRIRDEDIESGDTLLLLEDSSGQGESTSTDAEDSSDDPVSLTNIIEATRKMRIKNFRLPPERSDATLRPLLVTLIDYASTILKNHPKMKDILKDLEPYTYEELSKGRRVRCKRKNQLTRTESDGSTVESSKTFPEIDLPIDQPNQSPEMGRNASPMETSERSIGSHSASYLRPSTSTDYINPLVCQIYPKVPSVVDCVNSHKRSHFRFDPSVFEKLKPMGFDDEEIIEALWRYSNKQDPSIEWLTNPDRPKLNDLSRGLPFDHKFVTEILSDSRFVLGLLEPENFLALVLMVEDLNFNCDADELDPELNYLIQEIFRVTNPCDDDGTSESDDDDDDDDL